MKDGSSFALGARIAKRASFPLVKAFSAGKIRSVLTGKFLRYICVPGFLEKQPVLMSVN